MEAITPNGDGINDLWLLTNGNGCLTNIKAQVFNRYGAKVYESNNYQNNWNGTYKGDPLPDGTYYYIVNYTLVNGKQVILKGNLTILR
jgi:gliding motility-associated-like protein